MTAFNSVQNTAGGTADDSDAAEELEQRGFRDMLEIRSCACIGEAGYNQVVLAAVVAKNTGSICVNGALGDPYTSRVFHGGLQYRLTWHVSCIIVLEDKKLLE